MGLMIVHLMLMLVFNNKIRFVSFLKVFVPHLCSTQVLNKVFIYVFVFEASGTGVFMVYLYHEHSFLYPSFACFPLLTAGYVASHN